MSSDLIAQPGAAPCESVPLFDQHVLWSYGTGNVGVGEGELSGPHCAEENPFNPDEIVVAREASRKNLESDSALQGKLHSAVYDAHAATSEPLLDAVARNDLVEQRVVGAQDKRDQGLADADYVSGTE